MISSTRTIETVYEKGVFRPLEPIDVHEGLHFLVTILEVKDRQEQRPVPATLRGKYKGFLSSTQEFAARKQSEKALEL
jgi:predicted DNA-binding antitoxin AbrB/MazE fold protein